MSKGNHNSQAEKPSLVLLALVSQFLANNGFNSSSRIFNTERKKRPKKEGWQGTFGNDYTASFPKLEVIFKQWEEKQSTAANAVDGKSLQSSDHDSSSSEDNSTSSDSDEKTFETTKINSKTKSRRIKSPSSSSESDLAASSESDDSSNDGQEATGLQKRANTSNPLKRKASDLSSPSSSDDSSSSESDTSGSSSSEDERPSAKKFKAASSGSDSDDDSDSDSDSETDSDTDQLEVAAHTKLPQRDSADTSSSSEESSGSSSDSDESESEIALANPMEPSAAEERLSESSGTVTGDPKVPETSSSSNEDNAVLNSMSEQMAVKKKHVGAQPTRLAQLSAAANLDDYVSNDYVSYDYADKAYRDLVVTRGKGFTKEKNKKKRGSYRGGTIDTSGGKGFKFDD